MVPDDEDNDFPWDNLWEYLLGEDDDDSRDQRERNRKSLDSGRREASRCPDETGNHKTFWQRRKRESASNANQGEGWQLEFDLDTETNMTSENSNEVGHAVGWRKPSDKESAHIDNREIKKEQWQWELDLDTETNMPSENPNKVDRAGWRKPRDKESAHIDNREIKSEQWQWELDLDTGTCKTSEKRNKIDLATGWLKGRDKESQKKKSDESSWIGAIW
jgi:hypothetical protein